MEFHENPHSKNHTLLIGINDNLPVFLTFLSEVDKIRCSWYPHTCIEWCVSRENRRKGNHIL